MMTNSNFPSLALADWLATRDTIAVYTQVIGKVRRALTPHQKHWWHVSLRVAATGLTTTPIPAGDKTFELLLDFTHHRLLITTSHGQRRDFPLTGQSVKDFKDQTLALLSELGFEPQIDHTLFEDDSAGTYDETAVFNFWQALSQIDAILKEFKHGFRGESSPVQLWPHHFDLGVNWFSGRLIPDQDPDDPEWSDEQMNFGFSTGDGGIANPYFYITAYPAPAGLTDTILPEGAYWQTEGWTGAVLPYETLVDHNNAKAHLLDFLRTVHQAGSERMRDSSN
ncbi:MAG: hypothetical protein GWP61_24885 [Chloroflexi bacterium]|jgi:hypothetical protein|nr:hypothetical protein [Chloroflexota bacterium]